MTELTANIFADFVLNAKDKHTASVVNLAEEYKTTRLLLKVQHGMPPNIAARRLQMIVNHTIEQCAAVVEKLEGRKRGEIMKEAAQHIRKLAKVL